MIPLTILIGALFPTLSLQEPEEQETESPVGQVTPSEVEPFPPPGADVRLIDRVAVTVNEEVLTERELFEAVRQSQEPLTREEDVRAAYAVKLNEQIERMLMIQAGRDLGFQQDLLERQVDELLKGHKQRLGIDTVSQWLKARNLTSAEYREEARQEIYMRLWRDATVGLVPGPGGRVASDRFVRPGKMWFTHRQIASDDSMEEVVLQQLILPAAAVGGLESARELISELRRRIVEGEDFGELAEIYGRTNPGTRGISKPLRMADLCQVFPELCPFLQTANIDQISRVLPFRQEEAVVGFMIVKLLERTVAEPPPFIDLEMQKELRKNLVERRDRYRVSQGLNVLLQGSYVWPEEFFRPPDAPQTAAP